MFCNRKLFLNEFERGEEWKAIIKWEKLLRGVYNGENSNLSKRRIL